MKLSLFVKIFTDPPNVASQRENSALSDANLLRLARDIRATSIEELGKELGLSSSEVLQLKLPPTTELLLNYRYLHTACNKLLNEGCTLELVSEKLLSALHESDNWRAHDTLTNILSQRPVRGEY